MANNRKYKTDPELLLAQGKAIVAVGEATRYQHKVEMVNLVLGGLSPREAERQVDNRYAFSYYSGN